MTMLGKVHICISMIYELEAELFLSRCNEPLTPQSQGMKTESPIVM